MRTALRSKSVRAVQKVRTGFGALSCVHRAPPEPESLEETRELGSAAIPEET